MHKHTHTHTHIIRTFIFHAFPPTMTNLLIRDNLQLVFGLVHTLLGPANADGVTGLIGTGHMDLGGGGQLNALETAALLAQNSLVVLLGDL